MADEIRAPEHGARPGTTAGDPGEVREEIERTRARMSETIDDIEDVLLRKKARLQDRLDVLAPVRERPLPSAAAALGAGLLLGLLTGGEDDELPDRPDSLDAEERAEKWEGRARRLMRIARDQEEEIERLSHGGASGGPGWEEDEHDIEGLGSVRERISEGLTDFLGMVARDMFSGRGR